MNNRTAIFKQPDKISFFNDVYKLQKEYQDALISGKSNSNFIWIVTNIPIVTTMLMR